MFINKSINNKIYLRKTEITKINDFLSSKETTLHITGNPGTGKTALIFYLLQNKDFFYLNYLEFKQNINLIYEKTSLIIVIDEFDHLFNKNKKEVAKIYLHIRQNNLKLITLSNSLNLFKKGLKFLPYTADELFYISIKKLEEGGHEISENEVRVAAKRYANRGDLRFMLDWMNKKLSEKVSGNENILTTNEKTENFHSKIINSLMKNGKYKDKRKMYGKYVKECYDLSITAVNLTEFIVMLEIAEENKEL